MLRHSLGFVLLFLLLALSHSARPAPVVVDFEAFSDLEVLSAQIPGLTLSNATVLSSGSVGGSLNEVDFPPHSGTNVVVDSGGGMTIDFASPVTTVSGFFTYSTSLTFNAYDAGLSLVGTDISDFSLNVASSGDPGSAPNEVLGVVFGSGISRVTITGDPGGFSFVLDDLTFSYLSEAVPEPGTLCLVLVALALGRVAAWRIPDRRSQ
jgi:PEP-CTERM motif